MREIEDAALAVVELSEEEHQADGEVPSVLWIDFDNDHAFPLSIGSEHAQPHIGGRQSLTSGALWWMNYGRKGDPVFDNWELATSARRPYILEFEARFSRGSRFAATISAIDGKHILHQNHLRPSALHSDWIVELLQLSGGELEHWWVDWPNPSLLAARVAFARCDAHGLLSAQNPAA